MTLREVADALSLDVRSGSGKLDREIRTGYASDLMSDVIANGREGDLWVTLQIHQNVVAVAGMKDLAAVVLVNGREPEEDTLAKANSEGLPILVSQLPAFELIGRLYELGISRAEHGAQEV
jgi:hypothetical protein